MHLPHHLRHFAVAALVAVPTFAAAAAATQGGPTLTGSVIDASGAPAPGTELFLAGPADDPFDPPVLYARSAAGAGGEFALEVPEAWMLVRGWKALTICARHPSGALTAVRLQVEELPVGESFELRLGTLPAPGRLRILAPDGAPVAGARLTPQRLADSTGTAVPLPAEFAALGAIDTDVDGYARVLSWDRGAVGVLRIVADGFGEQDFYTEFGAPGWLGDELTLQPAAPLEITFEGDALPASTPFEIQSYTVAEFPSALRVSGWTRGTVRESGRVWYLQGDPFGSYEFEDPATLRFLARTEERADGVLRLVFEPQEGVPVTGRVVSEDGEAVAGVRLRASSPPVRAFVQTDAEGRFRFLAKRGPVAIGEIASPPPFLAREGPGFQADVKVIDAETEALDFGDIEIARESFAGGVVLAQDGSPAAGAWVWGEISVSIAGRMRTSYQVAALAGADGRFEVGGSPAGGMLELSARLGGAATLESVKAPAGGDPVTLTLTEFVAPRGRVLAGDGEPVEGVEVAIWKASPPKLRGGEELVSFGTEKHLVTDATGAFAGAPALGPTERYCVSISGPGIETTRTPWTDGATLARDVELRASRLGTVSGRLTGADGAALAGVRVFVRGGLAGRLETKTAADGTFTLDGVPPSGAFVFCDRGEDGFHGVPARVDESLDWRIEGAGGDPSRTAGPVRATRERELEIARDVLQRYLEHARASDIGPLRALQALAWVDPAFVLDELERGAVKEDWRSSVVNAVVKALAARSPDEALAVAELNESNYSSAMGTMYVFDELPDSERERKLELLALARAKVRRIGEPASRVVLLGWVAQRLLALGEEEAAREVLDEGVAVALDLPGEEWAGYARCTLAEELALVDLDAALELIVGDVDRHYGNVAQKLAALDPERAEAVLDKIGARGLWQRERFVPRIVYSMAPVDLDRALRLAELNSPRRGLDHVDAAFSSGMIALGLARSPDVTGATQERARAILTDAFGLLERSHASHRTSWRFRRVEVAGALLSVAHEIDPQRMESYVWRAVSMRTAPAEPNLGQADERWKDDGTLAFYVDPFDHEVALRLLEPVLREVSTRGPGELDSRWSNTWAALAVVDPERAASMAREGELAPDALRAIGSVLAREGEERRRFVQDKYVNLWIVGKEDL